MADTQQLKSKVVSGSSVKDGKPVELRADLFQALVTPHLVHETNRWQQNVRRAGTHATLNRSKMEGGGKKPWKQKGTGRARAGSVNSPLWVGGAVTFGPQPRDYGFRLPKRSKRQALASVLSDKVSHDALIVVESFGVKEGKTKEFTSILNALDLTYRNVLVLPSEDEYELVERAARNIPGVSVVRSNGVNVNDLLRHRHFLCSQAGLEELQDEPKSGGDASAVSNGEK